MPNHCSQDLYVYGDENSIKDLISFSQEDDCLLSANKYIPYPQKYKDMDAAAQVARQNGNFFVKDGFNSGGYEWCLDNWGTKWGMYHSRILREKYSGKRSRVVYNFDSAWSPATPVIKAMSLRYPNLRFKLKYYECGMGFKGTYEVMNGTVLVNEQDDYRGNRGG